MSGLQIFGIVLLLAAFVAVTWSAAWFSYSTHGSFVVETAWVVVPLFLAIGGGLVAVMLNDWEADRG